MATVSLACFGDLSVLKAQVRNVRLLWDDVLQNFIRWSQPFCFEYIIHILGFYNDYSVVRASQCLNLDFIGTFIYLILINVNYFYWLKYKILFYLFIRVFLRIIYLFYDSQVLLLLSLVITIVNLINLIILEVGEWRGFLSFEDREYVRENGLDDLMHLGDYQIILF